MAYTISHITLTRRQWDGRGGQSDEGIDRKRKRRNNFLFVIMRTNLIPSYCLTHAEGGNESLDLSQFHSYQLLNLLICNETEGGGLSLRYTSELCNRDHVNEFRARKHRKDYRIQLLSVYPDNPKLH